MINIRFESNALPADTFQVLQFDGDEEISHLFRFELHLVSRDPDIDFQAVLESTAFLAITTQDSTRYVHGMLCEFEQGGMSHSGLNEYRAVLVPRLWMLTQSQQNQIFQTQTVADIIENELGEFSDKGLHPLVESGLGVDDYEIYTVRDFYEREYVVQYKETDFNFISRLMEHEGIFYFFENDEAREKVVITDAMDVENESERCTAEFNKDAAAALYDRNVVYKLSRSQKQIPSSVLMKDYNYRSPDLPMEAKGDVTPDGIEGIGFVTEFGAHFKEPEEGEDLAAIRAEEFRCRQNIYSGESNVASFYSGGLYSLDQHFRDDYNRDYLITRVVHHGKQDIESWGNVGGTTYYNQFSCIPSGLQYRPQRITPKPRMFGIMNGIIDSEQDMGRADLDEEGRYKVMMPFDISGVAPGKASRRIRMAQPYGGGGSGMSFPLIKGTEVIWSCIDGDIDRPIITGVVPNPLNPSVTTAENSTSNVIKTTSGITMTMNDGFADPSRNDSGSGSGADLEKQSQGQNILAAKSIKSNSSSIDSPQPAQMNLKVHKQRKSYDHQAELNARLSNEEPGVNNHLQQQQHQGEAADINKQYFGSGGAVPDHIDIANPNEMYGVFRSENNGRDNDLGVDDKNLILTVPYGSRTYEDKIMFNYSYLHMGAVPNNWYHEKKENDVENGWFDYTDGNRHTVTQGKKTEIINGGDYDLIINDGDLETANAGHMHSSEFRKVGQWGESAMPVWRKTVLDHTCSDSYSFGDSESFFGGFTFDGFAGLSTEVKLGGSLSLAAAAEVEAYLGTKVSFSLGPEISYSTGGVDSEGTTNEVTGNLTTRVNVKPDIKKGFKGNAVTGVTALSGIVTAALAAGSQHKEAGSVVGGLGMGAAVSLTTGLTAAALADKAAKVAETAVAELFMTGLPGLGKVRLGLGPGHAGMSTPKTPGIDITPKGIMISCGPASFIEITPTGITMVSPKLDLLSSASTTIGTPASTVKMPGSAIDLGLPTTKLSLNGSPFKIMPGGVVSMG